MNVDSVPLNFEECMIGELTLHATVRFPLYLPHLGAKLRILCRPKNRVREIESLN